MVPDATAEKETACPGRIMRPGVAFIETVMVPGATTVINFETIAVSGMAQEALLVRRTLTISPLTGVWLQDTALLTLTPLSVHCQERAEPPFAEVAVKWTRVPSQTVSGASAASVTEGTTEGVIPTVVEPSMLLEQPVVGLVAEAV